MRKIGKIVAGALAAAMILSCAGCEKKATEIDGDTATESAASNDVEDNASDDTSSDNSKEESNSTVWTEHIEGDGQGFDYVDIKNAEFLLMDTDNLETSTVELIEFDKDYIHELCDKIFDDGQVEVYDYDNKTKRVYDDLIAQYENLLEIYDSYMANDDDALNYYPYQVYPYDGWEVRPNTEEFDRSVIEEDLERIKAEREDAPETIENDYSYGGYIGKINGEEYYMFLGNKKYDEYFSAPDVYQNNGRMITIMKVDMEGSFKGQIQPEEADASAEPDEIMNAIATDYPFTSYLTEEDPNEDYLQEAESFLSKIGYGDFVNSSYETTNLLWCNSVTNSFLNANDYHMTVNNHDTSDGQCLLYEMSNSIGVFPSEELLNLSDYSESELLESDAYIKVMINNSGLIGCQIFNPIKVLNKETISNLLDKEDIKDIVKESVNDKDLWNIPIDRDVNCFEIGEVRMISFPIKSDANSGEYTYAPCYLFWNVSSEYSSPFILINAIDGSIINVEDNLAGYPAGWNKDE